MAKTKVNWKEELPNIIKMGEAGSTLQTIGDKYGVTKQRVQQVLKSLLPDWKFEYGQEARFYKKIREED